MPAAVVFPESAADVAAAVRFAGDHGLRVAPQGTGHNAGPLGSLADTILLKTEAARPYLRPMKLIPPPRKAGEPAQTRPATHQIIKGLSERCTS